MIFKTKRYLNC